MPVARGADLLAQQVEELLDPALEQLERDVAGEAVGDDDVGGAAEQVAGLGVPLEPDPLGLCAGARAPRS